ncbi:photosynthetic complex assembly protein PuhC [Rhizobium rosettiformans]|jgi:putative photosynthetic complex assembly protein|uniref:Phosphonoacetaldehyde hydrolase n=2 Tax=Rhizobium rosettiformans TaxID=1368430 RepID=A0A4S8Q847_9HYPH|nr:photosynthetic complex assembly protein PuhC [Rhizobium rosettiformans]MBA4797661.1 phosphonoacetaldehyde hydrolase [Hyphomicrobiales bacterium]MBB5275324.1 putative photosynthetic complex assembly protein [Rhizobium rosettiformans]MDR7030681.1 putative photosynthetic complex assembly protein [Rhizobium rosettiformans]MDR7062698.1 putative photosynthetic complex assembly protein [Rhizobium rosettiformans]THV38875.1 phosphonoacetaldehyde hydrolase [Rhizobium rosettiformans W3]
MGSASHLGYWADRKGKTPNRLPRGLFFGLVGLLAFTAGAIVFGQTTGLGLVKQQLGAPVAIRDLMITRSTSDFVVVTDVATRREIASYGPQAGGFVRGSLRAFERMRQVAKVPFETPYRLIKWEAGAVSLSDIGTGERIYLDAFGPDNVAAFEALLGSQGGESQ